VSRQSLTYEAGDLVGEDDWENKDDEERPSSDPDVIHNGRAGGHKPLKI